MLRRVRVCAVEPTPAQRDEQAAILAAVADDPDLVELYNTVFTTPSTTRVFNDISAAIEAEAITRWSATKVGRRAQNSGWDFQGNCATPKRVDRCCRPSYRWRCALLTLLVHSSCTNRGGRVKGVSCA